MCCKPLFTAQKDLDVEGQGVAKRQDESEVSRKALVELSREFKKSSSEVRPQYSTINVRYIVPERIATVSVSINLALKSNLVVSGA